MGFSLRMGILASISWRLALPTGALFAVFAFAPAPGSIKALADGSKADKKTELRGSVAARQHLGGTVASAGPAGTNHVAIGARRAAEVGIGSGSIGLTGSRGSTGAYHVAIGTRRAAEAGIGFSSIGLTGSRGSTGAYHVAIGTRRAAEAGIGSSSIGLTGSRGSTGGYHIALGTRRAAEAGLGSGGAIGLTGSHGSAGATRGFATRIRPDPGSGIVAIGDTGATFSHKSRVHRLTTARTEPGIRLASSTTAARAESGTSSQRLGATSNR